MELADRVVVVTGGASGIGAALCRRFLAEGARAVVVADRDGEHAADVAGDLGERARAISADVGVEADIEALVDRTEDEIGPIDLFVSNAGLGGGGGIGAPDEVWEALWQVNVMAHVFAARAVVPRMVERGGGYLLSTASAAGLLTNLGNAPYSVTKHATVALAEWLAIAYGDAGIRVSCLCPMGVDTPMLRGAPGDLAGPSASTQGVISPADVADAVIDGLRDERFLILPHPEVVEFEQRRAADRDRWLAGLRRLQATLSGAIDGDADAG
jgi:NAD(P)-dependent dehydrogenase (short-subunit alcohol dehydrogenase family)